MFGLAPDNPDVPCPECRRIMVELTKMVEAIDNDATLVSSDSGYIGNLFWGRDILAVELFFQMIDWMFAGVIRAGRRRKLKRIAEETLPRFPRSLICPACFYLFRRA